MSIKLRLLYVHFYSQSRSHNDHDRDCSLADFIALDSSNTADSDTVENKDYTRPKTGKFEFVYCWFYCNRECVYFGILSIYLNLTIFKKKSNNYTYEMII